MRRIPKTVTTVMLTTLAVGLTGLLVEGVSDVSWLPIVSMTVTVGIATSMQQFSEGYQAKQKKAKGIVPNPVFVRVNSEEEAMAASTPGANDDNIYWWPEIDSSRGKKG